ncbi:MAG: NAD(P)/FAD-dependent oxidoreductase [Rhizomicrobium sp.]|jgi:4-hydroxyacetophenone monooxygenase
MSSCLPIKEDDAAIAKAIEEAHLPSLMAALVHVTGDAGPIRGDIKPVYDFFGDGQGSLTPEQRERVKADALAALKAFAAKGSKLPPQPSGGVIRELMDFVAGAKIPEHYVPFLMEELALTGDDPKAGHWGKSIPQGVKKDFRVLVIGAGMSGVLAAIRLKQAGIPFVIVDKNSDVGGTWFENTYPGCRVDNPNHLYSYSFEPNYDWPQHYSTQDKLWAYFRRVADKYGIRELVKFETEVIESVYDETRSIWTSRVRHKDGREEKIEANAIITAVGQLNRPKMPDVKGVETFKGISFHSSSWNHGLDLAGKRVAVIGTGASAFQFVPETAPKVGQMFVFQRSAPWLGPAPDYHEDVGAGQKWLLKHVPFYAQWYRFWMFWMLTDGIYAAVQADPAWTVRQDSVSAANDFLRDVLTQYIQSQSGGDDAFFKKVVPTYPPGGKRTVRDNGVWLAALRRPNVELIVDPIVEITPNGVKTKDGTEYKVDVIIYGTGFHASRFLSPMTFKGRGGVDLHKQWDGDARAYLGITIPNFPNLFCMYGPNTNIVVNGSIIFFSECEIRYIMGCIETLLENGYAAMEPRRDIHDAFNEKIDAGNKQMAWGVPQVTSWYKNAKGRVAQNWPFPLVEYWARTRAPDPKDFEFRKAAGR